MANSHKLAALSHGGVTQLSRVDFANWTLLRTEEGMDGLGLLYDVRVDEASKLFFLGSAGILS